LHVAPHVAPLQVGVPFATAGQTAQVGPQAVTLVLGWQEPLHML
jgi:hypothetical protein